MSSGTSRARKAEFDSSTWRLALRSRVSQALFWTSNERLPYRLSRETSARRSGRSRLMSIVSSHDRTNDRVCLESQQHEIRLDAGLMWDVCSSDIPTPVIQECVFS